MSEDTTDATKKRNIDINDHDVGPNLLSLDDDSLREILILTRASDHPNLRLCCQRINQILDSKIYRKERSEQGFSEVKVELLTPFEQYKKDNQYDDSDEHQLPLTDKDEKFIIDYDRLGYKQEHGCHAFDTDDEHFRVYVDGLPLHNKWGKNPKWNVPSEKCEFNLRVALIPRKYSFHQICNDHNDDLSDLSTTLLNQWGNPKVTSLAKVLKDNDNRKPLLYIQYFEIPVEYRSTSSTVGPLLLKALLKIFQDEHSLAIYVPDGKVQFTKEDLNLERLCDRRLDLFPERMTDEEIREKEKRNQRIKVLTIQDARQFLRAGFSQVKDKYIVNADKLYVFMTSDQAVANKEIISEDETLKLPIAIKCSKPTHVKTGLVKELFDFVKQDCHLYEELTGDAVKSDPSVTNLEEKLETMVNHSRDKVKHILGKSRANESHHRIIIDSDAIQCCAASQNLPLMKVMLEFFPEERDKRVALNRLSHKGCNALLAAASMAPLQNLETGKPRQFLESLISLGADKNKVNKVTGHSALGSFYLGMQDFSLTCYSSGMDVPDGVFLEEFEISRLLTPDQGATFADQLILG